MFFFRQKLKKRDKAREKVLGEFEKLAGYRFKDVNLLNTALTHPSYLNEKQITGQSDYERMEFLGDSVLALVVCTHIYNLFPEYNEGALSDIKSHVVSEASLAVVARRLGIGKFILFGSGEAKTGGRRKSSILANVFESVIGAIYLDGGFKNGQAFILKFASEDIVVHPPDRGASNFKGHLQRLSQQHFGLDPHYIVTSEHGPSHARTFEIEVRVKDEVLGTGKGKSKKEAEQNAAKISMKFLEGREAKHKKKGKSKKKSKGTVKKQAK